MTSNLAVPSQFPTLSYAQAHRDRHAFVQQLREALLTVGFLNLTDIEEVIPDWQVRWDNAFSESAHFFNLPLETKNRIGMINSRQFRGYSALTEEVTAGKPDFREQIDFGPETTETIPYPPPPTSPIELSLYGPSLYPSRRPRFREAILSYRARVAKIAHDLITVIAESLTPEPHLFTSLFISEAPQTIPDYSRMKVVRYPQVEKGEEGLGVGAHKDGGGLTLLAQDSSGGLQVQTFSGEWLDVPPIPYALVINVGQVLERMSCSVYPATTHRVLKTVRSEPRLSIPYFLSPSLVTRLIPLKPEQLHEDLRALDRTKVQSEVPAGDLHEELFGRAAWKGIVRSHPHVWEKYYKQFDVQD